MRPTKKINDVYLPVTGESHCTAKVSVRKEAPLGLNQGDDSQFENYFTGANLCTVQLNIELPAKQQLDDLCEERCFLAGF